MVHEEQCIRMKHLPYLRMLFVVPQEILVIMELHLDTLQEVVVEIKVGLVMQQVDQLSVVVHQMLLVL